MIASRRDTERGSGQERVVAAASHYGWSEVDYQVVNIPSAEHVWAKGDRVVVVRIGEAGQVLMAWAYRGAAEDRAARTGSSVIGAVVGGSNKSSRAVDLIALASR